jgi:hypothetical protein
MPLANAMPEESRCVRCPAAIRLARLLLVAVLVAPAGGCRDEVRREEPDGNQPAALSVAEGIEILRTGEIARYASAIRTLDANPAEATGAQGLVQRIATDESTPPELRRLAAAAATRIRLTHQVRDLLGHRDPQVRLYYAGHFGRYPSLDENPDRRVYVAMVVPALIRATTKDPNSQVRSTAALGLGSMCDEPHVRGQAGAIVRGLLEATSDEDREVQISAAVALGDFGRLAGDALPQLRRLARSDDPELADEARWAERTITEDLRNAREGGAR